MSQTEPRLGRSCDDSTVGFLVRTKNGFLVLRGTESGAEAEEFDVISDSNEVIGTLFDGAYIGFIPAEGEFHRLRRSMP
jgi:hypothetical protein